MPTCDASGWGPRPVPGPERRHGLGRQHGVQHRHRQRGGKKPRPGDQRGHLREIKNGEAKLGDLAPDSVNAAKAVNNSLTGADVAESSLGEVPAATLGGLGRDAGGPNNNCDPESGQGFVTCAITQSVNVSAPTRVLVVGQIAAQPELIGTDGNGSCRISSSAGALTESTAHTFLNEQFDNLVMSAVTNALEPGPIQFGIECSEAALIEYRDAHVSWVALSPS